MSQVKPIPDGFNTLSVYLIVPNCVEAMDFYQKAFGAETGEKMSGPDGRSTIHAEMRIGNSTFMLSDENPQWGMKSARTLGDSPASIHIYVNDADKVFNRAVEAGCEVVYPMEDTFWGDRYGKVKDPFGFQWGVATHQEDLTHEELERRGKEWFAKMAEQCQQGGEGAE